MAETERVMANILPSNATKYERTLASQVERLLKLGIPINDLWNPKKCPIEMLPYLAWALSVDIWNDDWPEHKKRRIVAESVKNHRLKGTLAGFEAYAEMADSEIIRAITPPGRLILSGGMTDAQRDQLQRLMPQIRIYRRSLRAKARRRIYLSARSYSVLSNRFVGDSQASERTKPRITLYEAGTENPISIEEVVGIIPSVGRAFYERALLRRPRRRGVAYCGKVGSHFTALNHHRSVAAFRRTAGATRTIRYGMAPANVDPEPFFTPSKAGRSMFFGRKLRDRFFCDTRSDTRVFERITIWDPDLVPTRRGASYLGVSRFGVKPFTAELVVHIPKKRHPKSLRVGGHVGQYLITSDNKKYHQTLQALRAAKSVRDTIFVNTKTFRSPEAGTLIVAGTPMIAGRLLRS